jgi:ElaB/YqjD/DUF883 family membrane-anchored ribosome-binding protein
MTNFDDQETDGPGTAETETGARARLSAAYDSTREKLGQVYHDATETSAATIQAAREKVDAAYATARDKASSAGQTALDGIQNNPLTVVAGGIAVGALIGALLPRTAREDQVLGAVGERLRAGAKDAAEAAKVAGIAKLGELGISEDAAKEKLASLLSSAKEAAASAGTAAGDAVKAARSNG